MFRRTCKQNSCAQATGCHGLVRLTHESLFLGPCKIGLDVANFIATTIKQDGPIAKKHFAHHVADILILELANLGHLNGRLFSDSGPVLVAIRLRNVMPRPLIAMGAKKFRLVHLEKIQLFCIENLLHRCQDLRHLFRKTRSTQAFAF
jgi:hypothetical protein